MNDNLDGLREIEACWINRLLEVAVQPAGDAAKNAPITKRDDLCSASC